MSPYLELIAVIMLPTAAFFVLLKGLSAARWVAQRWNAARYQAQPPAEPIERLEASLRRLRAELETMETRTDVPAKGVRLRALRGAYLDTLTAACRRLDVSPPPPGDHVPQAEIYRAEAALRQRGLDVRETAAPRAG